MKYRQPILVVAALASLGVYYVNVVRQESILNASNRFAQAVLHGETRTIWEFVPQDERAFYGFDQERFGKFWNEVVAPGLKQFDSYEVVGAGSNGIMVGFKSHQSDMRYAHMSELVSGQMGHYYVPYVVAYTTVGLAGLDARNAGTAKYRRFESCSKWFKQNKSHLEALGISKMRRGPKYDKPESIDEMVADFNQAAEHFKQQVTVATR